VELARSIFFEAGNAKILNDSQEAYRAMNLITRFFPNNDRTLERSLLLPLRNIVLLPGVTLPVIASRPRSVAVAQMSIQSSNKQIAVATVRPHIATELEADESREIESLEEIYPIATLATIQRTLTLPTGAIQLVLHGVDRIQIEALSLEEQPYEVDYISLPKLSPSDDPEVSVAKTSALKEAIQSLWGEIASLNQNFPEELYSILMGNEDPAELAYQTLTLLEEGVEIAQKALAENDLDVLLHQVVEKLSHELEVQKLQGEILGRTKKELDRQQREFFLRQQLQKIREELGENESEDREINELRDRLAALKLAVPAEKQAKRELARLERVGSISAEGGVIRSYLDWLLEMPWHETAEDDFDLDRTQTILDRDHYGLVKVKERILEYLATFKLKSEIFDKQDKEENFQDRSIGTVICFVGAPGVGKTSIGRSIARALNRPFERISLGGLRDESELRGHRRTYIGSMPGRIVQALHRTGVKNPVILLDEIDKVGMDYRGDPASVLLEILDPQQNYCFRDLYLDLDFDLSRVFFIATANNLANIPPALLDRLEVIELSGYSDREKIAIAEQYLLPRQLQKSGLPAGALQLPLPTLKEIIESYTREAGVRRLEQQIGTLCRKTALRYAKGNTEVTTILPEQLENLLGAKEYLPEQLLSEPLSGVATGLAWTTTGGEVLFVEAALLPEGENLTLTGQLGEVMEESAQIAYSYIWSRAMDLGIEISVFKENGIHLHLPSGGVPKDGPSAGVAMVVAMVSLLTSTPVRNDTAMTGEINLSGEVLPIGGVREKVLAAHRLGIKRVLLPKQNQQDLIEVTEDARQELEFIFCDRIEQVLDNTLISSPSNNSHALSASK
jgi:ATP-dependent Lon protease